MEYAQSYHSFLLLMPFQYVLGYQPPLYPWETEPCDLPAVDDWLQRTGQVWEVAYRTTCVEADLISDIQIRLQSTKGFFNPLKILQQISLLMYHVQLSNLNHISPVFCVSLLKPVCNSPLHPPSDLLVPLPHLNIYGSPAYAGVLGPATDILDLQLMADFHWAEPRSSNTTPHRDTPRNIHCWRQGSPVEGGGL